MEDILNVLFEGKIHSKILSSDLRDVFQRVRWRKSVRRNLNMKTVKQMAKNVAHARICDVSGATSPSYTTTWAIRNVHGKLESIGGPPAVQTLIRPVEFKTIPLPLILDAWRLWCKTGHIVLTQDFLPFSDACLTVFLFDSWTWKFTIEIYEKSLQEISYDINWNADSFKVASWAKVGEKMKFRISALTSSKMFWSNIVENCLQIDPVVFEKNHLHLPLSGQTFTFLQTIITGASDAPLMMIWRKVNVWPLINEGQVYHVIQLPNTLHQTYGLVLKRRHFKEGNGKEWFGGWGWGSWWFDTWVWSFSVAFVRSFVCLSMYQKQDLCSGKGFHFSTDHGCF